MTPARRVHTTDRKNIFKHYANKSHSELKKDQHQVLGHTARMKKEGMSTTPAHLQSIRYHMKNAKHSALKNKMK